MFCILFNFQTRSSDEMAKAFGVSHEEMNRIINESRQELAESGENPDEYFREVPVQRFMM